MEILIIVRVLMITALRNAFKLLYRMVHLMMHSETDGSFDFKLQSKNRSMTSKY